MRKFFARNIDRRRRMVRGVWGVTLIGSGLALRPSPGWLCLGLIVAGGFALVVNAISPHLPHFAARLAFPRGSN